ncbi:MAG: hypothetical protein WCX74_02810 [Candidatus Paceibacterota bacterium]
MKSYANDVIAEILKNSTAKGFNLSISNLYCNLSGLLSPLGKFCIEYGIVTYSCETLCINPPKGKIPNKIITPHSWCEWEVSGGTIIIDYHPQLSLINTTKVNLLIVEHKKNLPHCYRCCGFKIGRFLFIPYGFLPKVVYFKK